MHSQKTPEVINVSLAMYMPTLNGLDPFWIHQPCWDREPVMYDGKLVDGLLKTVDRVIIRPDGVYVSGEQESDMEYARRLA